MEYTKEMQEEFKSKEVRIVLYPSQNAKSFNTLQAFASFLEKEYALWAKTQPVGRIAEVKQNFQTLNNELNSLKTPNGNWKETIRRIISTASRNSPPNIFSCTPEGSFLLGLLSKNSPQQADAAYKYLLLNELDISNRDRLIGTMSAYHFKDFAKACDQRLESEKSSLESLRETYNGEFNSICTKLTDDADTLTATVKSTHQEWIEKQGTYEQDIDAFFTDSKNNLHEMEQLYKEKLRLQGPAEYWKDLNKEYTTDGGKWRKWALMTGVMMMGFLSFVLYEIPQRFFEPLGFNTIKATIIFALIASIGIYLVRFFVMLSTSAYHLSRDAYERYQLTHVYLSLLHEQAISETERNIVLQSIFCRADTGLLKGDSSPVFPSVLEQILKNIKK